MTRLRDALASAEQVDVPARAEVPRWPGVIERLDVSVRINRMDGEAMRKKELEEGVGREAQLTHRLRRVFDRHRHSGLVAYHPRPTFTDSLRRPVPIALGEP